MLETLVTAAILSLSMTVLHKIMLAWMSVELEKPYHQLDHSNPAVLKK
ncbi:MAG: hypothetical protein NW220_22590 [Leptolyngbyaceae cyanobacterium bins.349]|nr:hypothetical protein [Leptolyngbyaceae cyanobacterium bins.349]